MNANAVRNVILWAAIAGPAILGITGCGSSNKESAPEAAMMMTQPSTAPQQKQTGGAIPPVLYDQQTPTQATPPPAPQSPDAPKTPDGPAGGGSNPPTTPAAIQRQIIRNGELTLRIGSLDTAERVLQTIAAANCGYIANSSRSVASGTSRSGTVEIRVPASRFDTTLAAIRRAGEVEYESVTSNDVTEEYVDLGARLKAQQELEARLLKLVAEHSGKLADLIEVEGKLAEVRGVIEGIQGRLRVLGDQVAYSHFTITVVEPGAVGNSPRTVGGRLQAAWDNGLEGMIGIVATGLTLLIALLPVLLVAAVGYPFVRRYSRRQRERRQARANAAAPTANVAPTDPAPGDSAPSGNAPSYHQRTRPRRPFHTAPRALLFVRVATHAAHTTRSRTSHRRNTFATNY